MHQADLIPARHSSSETIEMEQPQHSYNKETVSLAPAEPHAEQNNDVIYGTIKTTVNNIPLIILVNSEATSSHITEKAVKDRRCQTHPRKKPLQVVGMW